MNIEKGIPIPNRCRIKYKFFKEMEVGDSVKWDKSQSAGSFFCAYWGKKLGRKFSILKYEDSYRIWRTE